MPYLVNRRSPITGGYIWYSWVIMVVPLGSEGSDIPLLKGVLLASVIRICGLTLFKYLSIRYLVNSAWLNIFDVVVASPILPTPGCLLVYF